MSIGDPQVQPSKSLSPLLQVLWLLQILAVPLIKLVAWCQLMINEMGKNTLRVKLTLGSFHVSDGW